MTNNKRAKAHATVKKSAWENNLPAFSPIDYNGSLIKWLNFFNIEVSGKDKQAWVLAHWKKEGKDVKGLDKLSETWFNQAGVLVKLLEYEYTIDDKHVNYLENKYKELVQRLSDVTKQAAEEETKTPTVKAPSIAERMDTQTREICSEVDAALDNFCQSSTEFSMKDLLAKHQVKAPIAKRVQDYIKPQLKEFEDAYKSKDQQLVEAYSHYGKRGLAKIISFLQTAMNDCSNMAVIARTTRKPRKRKEKPASVLAAKCQYLKEFPEFKMKSLPAEKMIGSACAILFDTKYRKLIFYEAVDGTTLSIKGTTLQNFDPNKSYSKIVRKPEILSGIQAMTKRPFNALIKGIRAVESKVNGRINNNQVILLVF